MELRITIPENLDWFITEFARRRGGTGTVEDYVRQGVASVFNAGAELLEWNDGDPEIDLPNPVLNELADQLQVGRQDLLESEGEGAWQRLLSVQIA